MDLDPHGLSPQTPGAKLDAAKVQADLLLGFSDALLEVAKVLDYGAGKYSRNGWQQVPEGHQRYTAALLRHLLAEATESHDKESGLLHASCVAWNALARLSFLLRKD